jgi:hypothetical protein
MRNHTHTQYASVFDVETQSGRKPHNTFSYTSLRVTFIGSTNSFVFQLQLEGGPNPLVFQATT